MKKQLVILLIITFSATMGMANQKSETSPFLGADVGQEFNNLAGDLENNSSSVVDDIVDGSLIDKYKSAGVWFLMKGVEAQIDFMKNLKDISDQEGWIGKGVLFTGTGAFALVGVAAIVPGAHTGVMGLKRILKNSAYKKLLSDRVRAQGNIEKLNSEIKMRKAISTIPQETRREIVNTQNKSAKDLFNNNQEKISKATERIHQLEKKVQYLGEKINEKTPVPKVTNSKILLRHAAINSVKLLGVVGGVAVLRMSYLSSNVLLLDSSEGLTQSSVYTSLLNTHRNLEALYSELTSNSY